jgi:hypothetical protein
MIIKMNNLVSIILLLFFSNCVFATETNERKLEIKAYSSEIKVGEPLILNIHVTSLRPNINPKTGKIATSGGIYESFLIVTKKGKKEEIKYEYDPILHKPLPIVSKDKNGLEYFGSFIVIYDQTKKSLLFNEPGTYSCRLEDRAKTVSSNVIEINVKPASKLEKKALSILTGEYDLPILVWSSGEMDLKNAPEVKGILDRFKQVVEQCGDTMLAKMAAAILGIEETQELENKYPNGEKFLEQYRKGEIKEPLMELANKHLSMAYQLPDGFPIRDAVLEGLAKIEYLNGNSTKVLSLFDELATKYPEGKYGKRALRNKKDTQEFIDSHPDLFVQEPEPSQETKPKPLGVVLPIAGAAAAGIVIAGLLIFLRKKNPKTSKIE